MASETLSSRFVWRGLGLYHQGEREPVASIEPDRFHPTMYRVRLPGRYLSDMVNLPRAKDAARFGAVRRRLGLVEPQWRHSA